jgi:4-aminobutyrate aminotransferase-like enzyme
MSERSNDVFRRYESPGTKTFAITDDPPVFVRGAGAVLFDGNDRQYLDFASGSGSTVLGHGHPAILAALSRQAATGLLHIGPHFHTPSQAAFLERLVAVLPPGLDMVQPATNGTEATEAALKIAMHATGRRRFIAFEGAYHGRTLGALAVSPARGANEQLGPFHPEVTVLAFPCLAPGELDDAECRAKVVDRLVHGLAAIDGSDVAGLLVEPVQATAGMRRLLPEAAPVLRAYARQHGICLIADEVFTGFGRTGSLFASPALGLDVDLMVLAKSLGGGVPAGLVAGTRTLVSQLPAGAQSSTFQLHPLAAATGLAMLETLAAEDLVARAQTIGAAVSAHAGELRNARDGREVRGDAALWGVVIEGPRARERTRSIRRAALGAGLVTWECGLDADVIGLVPPLVVGDDQIAMAFDRLQAAISASP